MQMIGATLNLMSRNPDIFETLIKDGVISMTPENSGALAKLRASRILLNDDENNFRLARSWRDAMERSFGSRSRFAAAANISDDVDRLIHVLSSLAACFQINQEHEVAELGIEASNLIWSMRDSIETSIDLAEHQARISSHETAIYSERVRRSRFHLSRASKLNDMLALLRSEDLRTALGRPGCRSVRREYDHMLTDHITSYSGRLLAVIRDLEIMLHQNMEVEETSRRRLGILRALRDLPRDARSETMHDFPGEFMLQTKLDFLPLADPTDRDLEGEMISLAGRAQRKSPSPRKAVKAAGRMQLVQDDEDTGPPVSFNEILHKRFDEFLITGQAIKISDWIAREDLPEGVTPNFARDIIFQMILAGSHNYQIKFIPDLDAVMTSRIGDMEVRAIPEMIRALSGENTIRTKAQVRAKSQNHAAPEAVAA